MENESTGVTYEYNAVTEIVQYDDGKGKTESSFTMNGENGIIIDATSAGIVIDVTGAGADFRGNKRP